MRQTRPNHHPAGTKNSTFHKKIRVNRMRYNRRKCSCATPHVSVTRHSETRQKYETQNVNTSFVAYRVLSIVLSTATHESPVLSCSKSVLSVWYGSYVRARSVEGKRTVGIWPHQTRRVRCIFKVEIWHLCTVCGVHIQPSEQRIPPIQICDKHFETQPKVAAPR